MAKAEPTNTGMTFTPPDNAKTLELAEFAKWKDVGDVLIGQVAGFNERPDPEHPGVMMKSFIVSPAAFAPKSDFSKGGVYHSLSLGLGAHLSLLFPTPERTRDEETCIAVRLEGSRPSEKRGKQPSHQFKVFVLTRDQMNAYLSKIAGPTGLPF